jgi:hypothetical protein
VKVDDINVIAGLLLAVLLAASVVVPVVYATTRLRRPTPPKREHISSATYAVTTIAAVGLAVGGLPIPFFLAAVALNITFGRKENVPLSRFPMFSRPAIVQWYIRIEDQDGKLLSGPAFFGMPTSLIMKRFNTEIKSADPQAAIQKVSHEDRVEAAERLGDFMIGMLKKKPRAAARITAVRLLYVEVAHKDGQLVVTPELLVERAP